MRYTLYDKDGISATESGQSVHTDILGNLAASLLVENADRSDSDETYDVKIQESPDDPSVADGSATWYDLVTFTQVTSSGTTSEKKNVKDPHFTRLRVTVTLGGTSPSADFKVQIEGVYVA